MCKYTKLSLFIDLQTENAEDHFFPIKKENIICMNSYYHKLIFTDFMSVHYY